MLQAQEIIEVALAANALHFTLEKWKLIDFYTYHRPKKWGDFCSFCFFFWCGFLYCYHDFEFFKVDWAFFYGLCIAELSRFISILYLKLIS